MTYPPELRPAELAFIEIARCSSEPRVLLITPLPTPRAADTGPATGSNVSVCHEFDGLTGTPCGAPPTLVAAPIHSVWPLVATPTLPSGPASCTSRTPMHTRMSPLPMPTSTGCRPTAEPIGLLARGRTRSR